MDFVSTTGETEGPYLDQSGSAPRPVAPAPVPSSAAGPPGAPAPGPAAAPVNWTQIVTAWTPGPTKYGFQVKLRCGSSSGSVADLQAQAPNLVWREYVTYSRNDFSHRIAPSSPTILPAGGVGFGPGITTVINPNLLEFNNVTDTHWIPTSAVRESDFLPIMRRTLPAVMESSQVYQYSRNNSNWTDFAGPFTVRRTLETAIGPPLPGRAFLQFTTDKVGIYSVTEPYKP